MRGSLCFQILSEDIIFLFFAQHPCSCNSLVVDEINCYFWFNLSLECRPLGSHLYAGGVRGLAWPLIFVLCDSQYSVRPDIRKSSSSGSGSALRATASGSAPVTMMSPFVHLVFWPKHLLTFLPADECILEDIFPQHF